MNNNLALTIVKQLKHARDCGKVGECSVRTTMTTDARLPNPAVESYHARDYR